MVQRVTKWYSDKFKAIENHLFFLFCLVFLEDLIYFFSLPEFNLLHHRLLHP